MYAIRSYYVLRERGVRVLEQPIELDTLLAAQSAGMLGGAIGTGTAARIALV